MQDKRPPFGAAFFIFILRCGANRQPIGSLFLGRQKTLQCCYDSRAGAVLPGALIDWAPDEFAKGELRTIRFSNMQGRP